MSVRDPQPQAAGKEASPLRLTAGCKVNLGLRITRIRPDGYHELDSLFLPLSEPNDLLELTVMDEAAPGIAVSCDAGILDPADNTLTKAYAAYGQASPLLAYQALHATRLAFTDPFSEQPLALTAPLPAALAALWEQVK